MVTPAEFFSAILGSDSEQTFRLAQRLINLVIPVLVRSLKSSNVDRAVSTWMDHCSSVAGVLAANP